MNQGRIWCVVHPTVGLPLLLGSVAVTSLIVHASIMTHTTWFGGYWMGSAKERVTMQNTTASPASLAAGPGFSMKVTPVAATSAAAPASFVITVTPTGAGAPATTLATMAKPVRTASAN